MTTCRSKPISYDVAGQIKSILPMREVAERYGVHFDEHGRAQCPFHHDSHPSGSIKHDRFHCYVCDLHLDIFDFVERLFDIPFPDAIIRLDHDFGLGLTDKSPDLGQVEAWKSRKHREEEKLEAYRAVYMDNVRIFYYIQYALSHPDPLKTWSDVRRLSWWQAEYERLLWWFDCHPWK